MLVLSVFRDASVGFDSHRRLFIYNIKYYGSSDIAEVSKVMHP